MEPYFLLPSGEQLLVLLWSTHTQVPSVKKNKQEQSDTFSHIFNQTPSLISKTDEAVTLSYRTVKKYFDLNLV